MLLLDEPLAALDLKLRRAMQLELKSIQREVGITFLFVTHDQDEALSMSDRIAIMNGGVIEQCGTPEHIYENPTSVFAAGFIGTSNLMPGTYDNGAVQVCPELRVPLLDGHGLTGGDQVSVAIRPEKIWLSELTPAMVQVPGTVVASSYHGATTQYLVDVAPDVTLTVLEQNLPRMSTGDRWTPGSRVQIGWLPEHTVLLRSPRDREAARCARVEHDPAGAPMSVRRRRRRAGLAGLSAARDLAAGGATVTVLEARDRVGGRVEQVELPDGRRVQLGGEVVGNAHTAYLGLVAELGLTLVPSYVAEPGEITRQVPESVDVGTWPSWFADADIASYETGRGGAGEGRRRASTRQTRSATPTCTGSTSSASATSCARPAPPPAVLRAFDLVHLSLSDGSIERQSMFAYARKQAVGGGTAAYDVERVGEPAGRRGLGHGRADDGGRAVRRTPLHAGLAASRSASQRLHGDHRPRARRSGPTRSCSPYPPVRRATSRSPASATSG